jgi:hypothetical protein
LLESKPANSGKLLGSNLTKYKLQASAGQLKERVLQSSRLRVAKWQRCRG